MEGAERRYLSTRVRGWVCALPLEHVVETMRPLPVEAVAGAPSFVMGLSVLRGEPVPVVDLASLLGAGTSPIGRFVSARAGERPVALAVESVLGVTSLDPSALRELPPLLQQARPELVAAAGVLDADLLLLLRAAHLVEPQVWSLLSAAGGPS